MCKQCQAMTYSFGFQAQEQDNEMWGGSVSFKYRVEAPRLGRFFSVDPLVKRIVNYSPYAFAGSKPIACIDFEGLEDIHFLDSFIRRQGCVAIEILENTQLGGEILEEFRNTDPEMCEGRVNIGYDAFVCAAPLGDNVLGSTSVLFNPGSKIRDIDSNGNPYLRDGQEAILEAIEKKSGAVWDRLSKNFPEELLSSEEFKASVAEGKGIIVVTVNEELFKENLSSEISSPVLPVNVGHEIGAHCLNKSQGIEKSVEEEHGDFCGEESFYTNPQEGSLQQALQEQVLIEIETRNE